MKSAILLLLISFNTWAINPSACSSSTKSGMSRCLKEVEVSLKNLGSAPGLCSAYTNTPYIKLPPLSKEFSQLGANCKNFISAGTYGPWGRTIADYIQKKGNDSVFLQNNLAGMSSGVSACPNWKKMSAEEKQHFWVWVMASISHVESTCRPDARNATGTNGVAIGLLQLDERQSGRQWRGPNCAVKTVSTPTENIRCGLDILEELLMGKKGEYKSNGEIWGKGSNSYWEHLRKIDGGKISDLIMHNPFCRN